MSMDRERVRRRHSFAPPSSCTTPRAVRASWRYRRRAADVDDHHARASDAWLTCVRPSNGAT